MLHGGSMASSTSPAPRKHHALAIPLPAQGHLNSMMRLCKQLASQGFLITFVDTEPIHRRIQQLHATPVDLHGGDALPGVQAAAAAHPKVQPSSNYVRRAYVPIDSGLDFSNGFRFSFEHFFGAMQTLAPSLERLLHPAEPDSSHVPPVTCLISDFFMTGPCRNLARKFDLPWIVFYPCSASTFLHLDYIFQGDINSQKEVVDALEKGGTGPFCASVEGLPPLNVEDLLSFKHMKNENRYMYEFCRKEMEASRKWGHALVLNTFGEAEADALKALKGRMKKPVYAVGPLLEAPVQEEEEEGHGSANATSLWQEDAGCMEWLHLQPPRSVLYIAFGSVTLISRLQFDELVAGILSSGHRFLFVYRSDLIQEDDDTSDIHGRSGQHESLNHSSEELLRKSHGQVGYVAQWTPQLRVLSHPAVAAFLTHCGFNSVMEALATGVPMLCWPYFTDQSMNAKLVVHLWEVGLALRSQIDGPIVSRDVVEQALRAVVGAGEPGNALRKNALRLKEACSRSLSPAGGPSSKSLRDLIQSLPPLS